MDEIADISVDQFARWWLHHRPLAPPQGTITRVGSISGICLFRVGQFQVEMFIAEPGASAPRHFHPNIDSSELMICGDINFDTDRNDMNNGLLRILPGESHVAEAGPAGVTFLSFQKWLNGSVPTTVTQDWVGAPIDPAHAQRIAS